MTTIIAYVSHSLMMLAVLFGILQIAHWKKYWPIAYVLSAVVIVLPINGVLLIEYSRGYFSDLSISTLMLVAYSLYNRFSLNKVKLDLRFALFVILLGLGLFPTSMGLTMSDPYVIGFSADLGYSYFVVGLAIISILAIIINCLQIAILIIIALITYNLKLFESQNIWNYLIDPLSFIYCVIVLFSYAVKYIYQKTMALRIQHA